MGIRVRYKVHQGHNDKEDPFTDLFFALKGM